MSLKNDADDSKPRISEASNFSICINSYVPVEYSSEISAKSLIHQRYKAIFSMVWHTSVKLNLLAEIRETFFRDQHVVLKMKFCP